MRGNNQILNTRTLIQAHGQQVQGCYYKLHQKKNFHVHLTKTDETWKETLKSEYKNWNTLSTGILVHTSSEKRKFYVCLTEHLRWFTDLIFIHIIAKLPNT